MFRRTAIGLLCLTGIVGCAEGPAAAPLAKAKAAAKGLEFDGRLWVLVGPERVADATGWITEVYSAGDPERLVVCRVPGSREVAHRFVQARHPVTGTWEKHGRSVMYYQDGSTYEGNYAHGKENGRWFAYRKDRSIKCERLFSLGIRVVEIQYHENGQKGLELHYDEFGNEDDFKRWNKAGKLVECKKSGQKRVKVNAQKCIMQVPCGKAG